MSLQALQNKWQSIEQASEYSNSYTSKTLRLEAHAFARSSEWGEPLAFGVDYGEHVPSRGMWANLESPRGQILNAET